MIRPQACPAGAHVRHIAAVRVVVVVVEPVYWVVKMYERRRKSGQGGGEDADSAGSFFLTRFLTKTRWDGAGYSGHQETVGAIFVGV